MLTLCGELSRTGTSPQLQEPGFTNRADGSQASPRLHFPVASVDAGLLHVFSSVFYI